ncbi:asparagine synthetase B, partial [Pseudomonas protegens]|nr:asparagine synthetase B [Pseudomonas protegens]
MCGITGQLSTSGSSNELRARLTKMMAAIRHRGPDDDGIWLDDQRPVGLGHVRLAIIDPENGKQPMVTEDGRYILVFNGAIYN